MIELGDILGQIVEPEAGGFSAELARHVLSLRIPPAMQGRSTELSEKAQQGTLTEQERAELDAYLTANTLLVLLKSKARVSLRPESSEMMVMGTGCGRSRGSR